MIQHAALVFAAVAMMALDSTGQTVRGDFNMDGDINVTDVTTMLNYMLTERLPAAAVLHDTVTVNGVSFVMVHVDGGTYSLMLNGCYTVDDYYIGQTEVTEELWTAVMGSTPTGIHHAPQSPAWGMTRDQCDEFIDSLNALTGMDFRLPSEDEWEYAAAGGCFTLGRIYAGSDDIDEVAWYLGNYSHESYVNYVATKAPNELGLYDMSGSVWEWCSEARGYNSQSLVCALRGGGFMSSADQCRVTSCIRMSRDQRSEEYGLRLVRSAGE